jgi:hypothetical protein
MSQICETLPWIKGFLLQERKRLAVYIFVTSILFRNLVCSDTTSSMLPTYIIFSFHLIPTYLVPVAVNISIPHHVSFQTRT